MVKEISDKYVVKNDLTLFNAIEIYIPFAPQIKNKKEKNILIDYFKISDVDEFTSFLLHEKKV